MTHLRHITVFVDEPDPGHFHWVLHESTEDGSVWIDIDSSVLSFPSWMDLRRWVRGTVQAGAR